MSPRYTYYQQGSPFNEWHRTIDGLGAVDVDLMEVCNKGSCYEPLLLIEHAYDKGQTYKNCTAIKKLAKQSNLPAILIFYTNEMKTFRVKKLAPVEEEIRTVQSDTLIRYFKKLHNLHQCN